MFNTKAVVASPHRFARRSLACGLVLYCILSTALLLLPQPSISAPLRDVPQKLVQPDGVALECLASGDEHFNWMHDENGYVIIQDHSTGYYTYAVKVDGDLQPSKYIAGRIDPSSVGLIPDVRPSPAKLQQMVSASESLLSQALPAEAPSSGTINNIVVFIRFKNESEFTDQVTLYDGMFNSTVSGENSMVNYFQEISYNALSISTTFYPTPSGATIVSYQDTENTRGYYQPYDASTNPIGYQGGDNGYDRAYREQMLLKNAVNAIASQVPTSLNVDGDNDGLVDNVCFVICGSPTGWSSLLWPHKWDLYSQIAYVNGKRVYTYNFQLQTYMLSSGVGVLCHEMFHTLGAPDLYHYSFDGKIPVGSWDIMENNQNPPQHPGAYMKYRYGHWISSIPEISAPGVYTLNPLTSSTGNCYKIATPNSPTEYYVVEYRKKTGTFESSVPGSGLLVYRINTARDGQGNAGGPPDEVYIYRPNGTCTANGSYNSANFSIDVGRTAMNDTTNPAPFLSNCTAGGISISEVGSCGSTISFRLLPVTSIVQDPVLTPGGNAYRTPQDVSVTSSTSGAVIHYTTNGVDPTESDLVVAGPVSVDRNMTLKAKAWKTGCQPSNVKSAVYTFAVATPAFSPDGGNYSVAQNVVVTCATVGATIHYTTTGVDPTEADPTVASGSTVTMGARGVLKAKAWKDGWTPSYVKDAEFNIGCVVYVKPGGSDSNSGLTWDLAKATVQAALNQSQLGDRIWVAKGTYSGCVTMKAGVAMYGGFAGTEKQLSKRPPFPRPASDPNATVLDGGASGSVVTCPSDTTVGDRLDGFVIRNGSGTVMLSWLYGGGVFCAASSSPTIANNTITANITGYGAGIECYFYSSPAISNNIITGNTATLNGGGIHFSLSSIPTIANNVITGNAANRGGGLFCVSSSAVICNNTISGNTGTNQGGGIACSSGTPSISNNIVAFNSSGIYKSGGTPTLRNNDVYGNTSYDYSGLSAGVGDISADPLLVNRTGGDYHLTRLSPCVNIGWDSAVGVSAFDMDGEGRKNGVIDIGADEYWPKPASYVRAARLGADGDPVDIDGAIVSAQFVDFFYIEPDDQTCGIRVNNTGHTLAAGMRVHVIGSLSTNSGERCIEASDAHRCDPPNDSGSVGPVTLGAKSVGGVDLAYEAGPPVRGQQGVKDGIGLNNIGLLVHVTGRITTKDTSSPATRFTLDDGSGIEVKAVVQSGIAIPDVGAYVSATGVSSCEKPGSDVLRLIRVYGDIQTMASH